MFTVLKGAVVSFENTSLEIGFSYPPLKIVLNWKSENI